MTTHYITRASPFHVPLSLPRQNMRRPESAAEVTMQAAISASDLDRLDELLPRPLTGVRSWLVRNSLAELNRLLSERPDIIPSLLKRIANLEAPGRSKAIMVLVPRLDYEVFNTHLPVFGATSWFIREVVKHFIQELQDHSTLDTVRSSAVSRVVFMELGR